MAIPHVLYAAAYSIAVLFFFCAGTTTILLVGRTRYYYYANATATAVSGMGGSSQRTARGDGTFTTVLGKFAAGVARARIARWTGLRRLAAVPSRVGTRHGSALAQWRMDGSGTGAIAVAGSAGRRQSVVVAA